VAEARRGLRTAFGSLTVALLAGACGGSGGGSGGGNPQWSEHTTARQAAGEERLHVSVQYGAGTLELRPAPEALLYRMDLRYDEEASSPLSEYDADAGRLRLGLTGVRGRNMRGRQSGSATIELAPTVPLDLKLEFGAGDATLDLGAMTLRSVDVSTGASRSRVRFDAPNRTEASEVRFASGASTLHVSGLGNARAERYRYQGGVGDATFEFDGEWTRGADVRVEMGVGALRLRFPRELGVRIERRGILSSFQPEGMERRDNAWYSAGWEGAEHRVTVAIESAVGSVDVSWMN
jgi:hypothetical protein